MKKLWLRQRASLLLQRTRKSERQREARDGWGPGGELKETSWDNIYLVPTPYPVKSCILQWRPVFSQFHPRVEQMRAVNGLQKTMIGGFCRGSVHSL